MTVLSSTKGGDPGTASPAQGPLWNTLAAPLSGFGPLSGEQSADLAIIGGGILGVSTALHAAMLGLETVVLEAETIGFGASGRNTGFVVPSLKSALGPAELELLVGKDHAARLLRLVSGSGSLVFDLIETHGIACAARQSGWLQPGHSAAAEAMLKTRLPGLQAAGLDVEFLNRPDMIAQTGLPRLHGGLRVTTGGQINPLAYVRGLARAAAKMGAKLHEKSPATHIKQETNGWRIETATGMVSARHALLTTNAMVGTLSPAMRSSIIPVRVFQVATQPLSDALRQRVLPAMAPVADTRRHTFALRWSEDGRLITGGMVSPLPNRADRARRSFLARIAHQVPDCPPLSAERVWDGVIAATPDALPRLIRLAPGLTGAIGCNGRGVALTTALGATLADLMAGKTDEADFVVPVTPPRPVPFSRLSGLAPHLWLPASNLRDGAEARFH